MECQDARLLTSLQIKASIFAKDISFNDMKTKTLDNRIDLLNDIERIRS